MHGGGVSSAAEAQADAVAVASDQAIDRPALAAFAGAVFIGGSNFVAVVYLVAATVGLFLLVLVVVQRWAASATSYMFVLMPVVAVALGAQVADEPITVTTVVGGTIVCAGVYFGASRRDQPAPPRDDG